MKKLMFTLIVVSISILLVTPTAMAYQQGDYELTLGGNGSSDESLDGTVLNFEAGLGYFLTRNFEAIWRQGISYVDIAHGDDKWNASTRLSLDFNFGAGSLYPYLGANIGYLYGDTVEEQFIAGPEGGVKYFVNDTTFITAGIEYQFLFEDTDEVDDNYNDGRFVYLLGIGFKF
ncbi:MAG: hypothetical protein PF482_15335 [Desulfobacteraceae bacterium]|jgi:hypothetical protein|nr:hypothetical protein [Desulfobacteraceae bacterium]